MKNTTNTPTVAIIAAPVAAPSPVAHPTFLVEVAEDTGWARSDLYELLADYANASLWGVGPISASLLYGDCHYAIAAVTLRGQMYGSALNAVAFDALKNVADKCYVYRDTGEIFADVLDSDEVANKGLWAKVQGLEGQLSYRRGVFGPYGQNLSLQ